jgi:Mn2+/Fe2+ NRAMP family transporter
MGWESGVDKNFKEAPNFFTIFTALIVISVIAILLPNIHLFSILIWSQVLNGILIPLILIFILNLCNDPDVMGEYTNSKLFNAISYGIIFLMIVANMAMMYYEFIKPH